jgi:hypothetical protein
VRLANDWNEPQWTVESALEMRPDALRDLAEQARSFFANA